MFNLLNHRPDLLRRSPVFKPLIPCCILQELWNVISWVIILMDIVAGQCIDFDIGWRQGCGPCVGRGRLGLTLIRPPHLSYTSTYHRDMSFGPTALRVLEHYTSYPPSTDDAWFVVYSASIDKSPSFASTGMDPGTPCSLSYSPMIRDSSSHPSAAFLKIAKVISLTSLLKSLSWPLRLLPFEQFWL